MGLQDSSLLLNAFELKAQHSGEKHWNIICSVLSLRRKWIFYYNVYCFSMFQCHISLSGFKSTFQVCQCTAAYLRFWPVQQNPEPWTQHGWSQPSEEEWHLVHWESSCWGTRTLTWCYKIENAGQIAWEVTCALQIALARCLRHLEICRRWVIFW